MPQSLPQGAHCDRGRHLWAAAPYADIVGGVGGRVGARAGATRLRQRASGLVLVLVPVEVICAARAIVVPN